MKAGSEVDLSLAGDKVILRPVFNRARASAVADELHGLFQNVDLLANLQAHRKSELDKDGSKIEALRS